MGFAELVDTRLKLGVALDVISEELHCCASRGVPTPELSEAMCENEAELLELLRSAGKTQSVPAGILAGHRVEKVVWETGKAVVFEDEYGLCWR